MDFAYNNTYYATIKIATYEALYAKKYKSPLDLDDIRERCLDSIIRTRYNLEDD